MIEEEIIPADAPVEPEPEATPEEIKEVEEEKMTDTPEAIV